MCCSVILQKTISTNYVFKYIMDGKEFGVLHVTFFDNFDKKSNYEFYQRRPFISWSFVNSDYRKQGIGTQLYFEAARYFNAKGYRLYCSDLMSMEAKIFWNKLKLKYPNKVFIDDKTYVRDYNLENSPDEEFISYYIFSN
jgi:GNAT superfamily N-acetyltransferase